MCALCCDDKNDNWNENTLELKLKNSTHTHTHARLTALCPGLPRWASTRKVKPIWILLKQETMSGSGISWAPYQSAPCSRQTTTPAPHHSVFYRPDALPATQPTASKHWGQLKLNNKSVRKSHCSAAVGDGFFTVFFTQRRYASGVYAMALCPCLSQVGVLLKS